MNNSAYWKKRAEALENMAHATAMETCANMDKQYVIAQAEIDKQIRSWYSKYAANNEISLQDAQRELTAKERAEFKWTVEEYIKRGEELDLHPEWITQMKNSSAAHHINRLEALKIDMQQSCEKLYKNQLDSIGDMARKVYSNGYYHEIFDIQQGIGTGWKVNSIKESELSKVINKPWTPDGEGFSSRIWKNKDKLVNTLHTEVTQSCITGRPIDEISDRIAKDLDTTHANARRLALTESAHFAAESDIQAYKDSGVEQYKILATLDSRTSEICRSLDGKVFDLDQAVSGETVPPFHPNCRTTTVAYFDDEFTVGNVRAARGDDEKTVDVPADMTYKEWQNNFRGDMSNGTGFDITENGKYIKLPDDMSKDEYENYIRPEIEAQFVSPENPNGLRAWQQRQLWDSDIGYIQASPSYKRINEFMRGLRKKILPEQRKTIRALKQATSNCALTKDYVGYRKVDPGYLPDFLGIDEGGKYGEGFNWHDSASADRAVDKINSLVGSSKATIPDKAVTSISMVRELNYFKMRPIEFHIQLPKGTKGLLTGNYKESEFIAKNDSSLEIIGAERYNYIDKKGVKNYYIKIFAKIKQ